LGADIALNRSNIETKLITTVKSLVKIIMGNDEAHGYPHIERVEKLALWIASHYENQVDKELLLISILLHDIGRFTPKANEVNHAVVSAEIAEKILRCLGYPEDRISLVKDIIKSHSYSLNIEPKNIEAKILSDADKLDALGAIGIARVFIHSARFNRSLIDSLNHFKEKIVKLPSLMYTEVARKEAMKRLKIVLDFIKSLEEELKFIGKIDKTKWT